MLSRLAGARWIGLLLLLTALFYWKLGFSNRFTFLDSPDLVGQVLPWYETEAKAWNDGIFPLWDPYAWSGQPTLGQMQPGGAFPLNWPLFAAPLDPDGHIRFRFVHLQRLSIQLLAALFAYGLARELGRSRMAALWMGLAFSCVGALPSFDWPQVINGAIWLPLTLLLFHRAVLKQPKSAGLAWAVLCGGSIGLSLLSGHHQTPFYSLLALGGVFAYLLWEQKECDRRELAWTSTAFVTAAGVAFAVAALQLLPAFEYAEHVYRWIDAAEPISSDESVPYYIHTPLALAPIDLAGLVTPRLHAGANVFVGWAVAMLGFYGVATCWRERWVRGYALLAAGTVAYAVGGFSLVHGWIYHFAPAASAVRSADRAIFVAQLSLFVLAAFGLDRLTSLNLEERRTNSWLSWAQRVLLFYVATVYAASLFMGMKGELGPGAPDLFAIGATSAFLLAVLLEAYKRGALSPRALGFVLTGLMLCESYATQFYDISDVQDPSRRVYLDQLEKTYSGSMHYLEQRAAAEDRFRFQLAPDLGGINIGARHELEQTDGYLVTVNKELFDIFGRIGWNESYDLLNTRYTIARQQLRVDQTEVFADANGLKVFLNPKAGPRSWMDYSNQFISDADFTTTRLENVADCPEPGRVRTMAWSIQSTKLEAESACPGYLVLADPYFNGWQATVDEVEVPILRYQRGLRALYVPAGTSTVEFRYLPKSVARGAWITGFGFVLCCGAGLWLRFRSL